MREGENLIKSGRFRNNIHVEAVKRRRKGGLVIDMKAAKLKSYKLLAHSFLIAYSATAHTKSDWKRWARRTTNI